MSLESIYTVFPDDEQTSITLKVTHQVWCFFIFHLLYKGTLLKKYGAFIYKTYINAIQATKILTTQYIFLPHEVSLSIGPRNLGSTFIDIEILYRLSLKGLIVAYIDSS